MTQALILVGGQGTRLRPLTCRTPKSMVPVLNMPFLEHVILNLKAHNILEIVLAQHHLAESINQYFGDGSKFGVKLTYVMEDFPMGTAGAVKNAERYLTGPFFVLNGDIFQNRNFTSMMSIHRERKAKVTISLTPVPDPTIYGVVETDDNGKVRRFLEKPKLEEVTTNLINAGTYVLEPEVLKRIPSNQKYSFERELFPGMLRDGEPVFTYSENNYWMDTGTPEKYLQLHRDLLGGKCEGYSFDKDLMLGKHCRLDASVETQGKVYLGDNCRIEAGVKLKGPVVCGNNCTVKENSIIHDSVIWHDTAVGKYTGISSSSLAEHCHIGDNCTLQNAVLGDHIKVVENTELSPGAKLFPEGCGPND